MELKIKVSANTINSVKEIIEEIKKIEEKYPSVSTFLEVNIDCIF